MDRDRFWQLVDTARAAEDPLPTLGIALAELSRAELIAFQRELESLVAQAYRWDLWGAAYLAEGGCSDDGFTDFRYGLIAQGRAVFEAALADPDSLAEHDAELFSNELFGYVAHEVYEATFAGPLPASEGEHPSEPEGEAWDFDDPEACALRLPKLWDKYGS